MKAFSRKQNLKYFLIIAVTAFAVLALSFAYSGRELRKEKKHFVKSELTVMEASDLLKESNDVVLIDLRTPGEFSEGHVRGSVFVDYFNGRTKQTLGSFERSKNYLLIDKAGRSTRKILKKMKKLGFNEAHTIIGGMEDWYRNRLPVEKIE